MKGAGGKNHKGALGNPYFVGGVDGYVHYFDCTRVLIGIYVCLNLKHTLNMHSLLYANYTSVKFFLFLFVQRRDEGGREIS